MKFDTAIIGGGLSGLTAGITLAEAGRRVAIVSAGQSCLHFSSGSLDMLGYDTHGTPVTRDPLSLIPSLPENHPYSMLGTDRAARYASLAPGLFDRSGIKMAGSHHANHWRLSPAGMLKTSWLTMEDYTMISDPSALPWKHVAIVNLLGFLDFFPKFIAYGLERRGVKCEFHTVTTPELETLRLSTTEMRAANIARTLHGSAIATLAEVINNAVNSDVDAVLLPATFGFEDFEAAHRLVSLIRKPATFVATMGPSVPGIRTQMMLVKHFRHLGGVYFLGDSVRRGHFDGPLLSRIETFNLGDDPIEAGSFIFAAGSFFSHGLTSNPDEILEPVFGLDVDAPSCREKWFSKDIFHPQPYMKYGIATDRSFRALRAGRPVENLMVCGAALPGADTLLEGSGAGVAMFSAMYAAESIISQA